MFGDESFEAVFSGPGRFEIDRIVSVQIQSLVDAKQSLVTIRVDVAQIVRSEQADSLSAQPDVE